MRLAILFSLLTVPAYAAPAHYNLIEGGYGYGTNNSAASFGYQRTVSDGIDLFASLNLQGGLKSRLVHLSAEERKYQTAGSADRENGPIENITVKNTKQTAVNQGFFIELASSSFPVFVGFNLDLFGYTFAEKNSSDGIELDGGGWNLFRWAYNDLGTLHSETYLGVLINQYTIKVGTSHSSTQYRVVGNTGSLRTTRFLNFSDTVFASVGYGF
jgi:hypothetical protein